MFVISIRMANAHLLEPLLSEGHNLFMLTKQRSTMFAIYKPVAPCLVKEPDGFLPHPSVCFPIGEEEQPWSLVRPTGCSFDQSALFKKSRASG